MNKSDVGLYGPDDVPPRSRNSLPVCDPDARPLPIPIDMSAAPDTATGSPNLSVYVVPATANTSAVRADQSATEAVHVSQHAHLQLKLEHDKLRALEAEVRLERDTLRRKLNETEKRLALCEQVKSEESEVEMRLLRVQMERKEHEHSAEMKEMLRKIAWYVEHQEFSKDQEELITQQQETIHTLRLRFQALESQVSSAGIVRTDKDRQIQILQRRNLELEDLIKQRYPNSIPELIRSCQPSARQTTQTRQLEGRIVELQEQLAEKDRNSEGTLIRLRGEADQLRLHFQQRLTQLEEEMKSRLATTQTKKVTELEKQVVETRRYYTEKIKSQEMVIQSLRRGGSSKVRTRGADTHDTSSSHPSTTAGCQTRISGPIQKGSRRRDQSNSDDSDRSISPRRESRSKRSEKRSEREAVLEKEMVELRALVAAMSTQRVGAVDLQPPTSNVGLLSTFQRQVSELQQELAVHKRLLQEAHDTSRNTISECDTRLAQARREWGDEIVRMNDKHADDSSKLRRAHEQEIGELMGRLSEAKEYSRASFTKTVVDNLHRSGTKSGFTDYVRLVTERLQVLEERQIVKEKEFATQLAEIKRLAEYELAVEKEKCDLLIDQKNNEIRRFRVEMDDLLTDMARLGRKSAIQ